MATMGLLGMMVIFGLRVNLSVAIVAMVNHNATRTSQPIRNGSVECPYDESSNGTAVVDMVSESNPVIGLAV